jgi:hypothetical protein
MGNQLNFFKWIMIKIRIEYKLILFESLSCVLSKTNFLNI